MNIAIFKRNRGHYAAMLNGEKVGKFDYAVPIVIVAVSEIGGCLYDKDKVVCWSPDWKTPGPALVGKPKSDTCIILDDRRQPVLDAGLIQSKCEFRKKECMPSIKIVFAVMDEEFNRQAGGLRFYSYAFLGDEVGGRADHEQMLFSPRSFHSILKMRSGNECAKHKVFLKWSEKEKRSYIHIPEDTSIGPNPQAEQRNYDALVTLWQKHEDDNTDAIMLSVDPRLWSSKFQYSGEAKSKKARESYKSSRGIDKPNHDKLKGINMALGRKTLKPETRARLEKEKREILGEEE